MPSLSGSILQCLYPKQRLNQRKPLVDLKSFPNYEGSLTNKMLAYTDRVYTAEEWGKNLTLIATKLVEIFGLENEENYENQLLEVDFYLMN